MRVAVILALLTAGTAHACTLCFDTRSRQTLRQEAGLAKLVLYGTLSNPKLSATGNGGTTDFAVERVLKDDAARAGKKAITLPRYVPADPKNPPKFLIFCDVYDGKFDPYRGNPVKSAALVEYVAGQLALDPKDRQRQLLYCFRHLDAADDDVAGDAFLELAKATDAEVAALAGKLEADKLRKLLGDAKTPADRLGLYAFLLATCGTDADADLLLKMLRSPTEQTRPAFAGLLAGLVQLRPKEGWAFAQGILADESKPFADRYAAVNALKFLHNCRPAETKGEVLKGLKLLLPQADAADLALEEIRKNGWWEATPEVLAAARLKSHSTPLLKRSLLRYALSCPKPEAAAWAAEVRKADPETVKDIEEALSFERDPVIPASGGR